MLKYRADIDGLRAIAVLIVLFFHLDFSLFKGGFVGVDVFFTISGFLITGIVLKESKTNGFSFLRFYSRRATRLIPAYLVVLLFTIVVGFIFLTPLALKELLQSGISSTFFASNFYFLFTQGGYFSNAAHETPLLHTWSLSVEEQFYLVMPLAVVLWLKIRNTKLQNYVLVICFILTVLASYLLTKLHQPAAYFLVISRAHEFLLGSILAVIIYKNSSSLKFSITSSNFLFAISLLTLLYTALTFDAKSHFPGLLAVIPCLATGGVIFSGINEKCISHRILGNRLLVFIGLLSYSLYLWHWPLITFFKLSGIELDLKVQLSLLFLSLFFAYLSWRYVEKIVRYAKWSSKKRIAAAFYILPCVALGSLFFYSQKGEFYPERFDKKIVAAEVALKSKPELGRETCHTNDLAIDGSHKCQLGSSSVNSKKAILWGDSHASHFAGLVDVVGKGFDIQITEVSRGNCPPLLKLYINAQGAKIACIERNNTVLKYILERKPKYVFLGGAWGGYLLEDLLIGTQAEKLEIIISSLTETINILLEHNIKPIVLEMLPRQSKDASACYLKTKLGVRGVKLEDCTVSPLKESFPELVTRFNQLKGEFSGKITFITPENLFCNDDKCKTYLDDTPLYRDINHLNLKGSIILGQQYIKKFGYLNKL
ncbi:acyltransferase family protein [Pseudoalteromonas denitrificans]|uniref:Peptidoglycan/LPS O-acetylase OafA/YrhL, contains acyltransferase and SGNH-hydrolase domains n=1 Tax=Pseudoalteromonas denitrificans DSM 6059 TaxID=1123010 RepID=A0A1I1SL63_9GAMM|nr:acyltransferase family protein [Pseudoalteromonas denitrificans]SFD44623.1 Peptidoglycan/LPS O-acetylase OafA/YrhL, contains acyltransferase and SGNH-hydrolase domains [Pseudoalteromonas denitrificans DSM 6059]